MVDEIVRCVDTNADGARGRGVRLVQPGRRKKRLVADTNAPNRLPIVPAVTIVMNMSGLGNSGKRVLTRVEVVTDSRCRGEGVGTRVESDSAGRSGGGSAIGSPRRVADTMFRHILKGGLAGAG